MLWYDYYLLLFLLFLLFLWPGCLHKRSPANAAPIAVKYVKTAVTASRECQELRTAKQIKSCFLILCTPFYSNLHLLFIYFYTCTQLSLIFYLVMLYTMSNAGSLFVALEFPSNTRRRRWCTKYWLLLLHTLCARSSDSAYYIIYA